MTFKLPSLLIITAIVGSILSHQAAAANLSVDGTGQVLLYPYFTVEKGQQTAISIVNTSEAGKAIKVRFLEGYNGRQVFGFNLYLAPLDVWVGSVVAGSAAASAAAPPAAIRTDDSSCTVPAISAQSVNFQIDQFTGVNNDSGPDTSERTREGYVEVIEMGAILPMKFDVNQFIVYPNGTFTAMQHGDGGAPASCASIRAAWPVRSAIAPNEPTLLQDANNYQGVFGELALDSNDISAPSGGLFGAGSIIDTQAGSVIGYAAEAIDGFRTTAMHTGPGHSQPTLNSAEPISHVIANGELVTSHWRADSATGGSTDVGSSIDAVSALLQARSMTNAFVASVGGIGSASEWVVTLPTRRFYVDSRYGADLNGPFSAAPPFRSVFSRLGGSGEIVENNKGFACELAIVGIRDDNERGPIGGVASGGVSTPGTPPPNAFCFSTQIVTINQAGGTSRSSIFGSQLTFNEWASDGIGSISNGWMRLEFGRLTTSSISPVRSLRRSIEGHQWQGLPSIGFWALTQENANQKFGGAFAHKRTRSYTQAR